VEHACFFWSAVDVLVAGNRRVAEQPSMAAMGHDSVPPGLADLVNTGLSAVLSFSDHVLYPSYQLAPRLWGISALDDQAAAGAIMWVPGSIAFLVPAVILGCGPLSLDAPGLFNLHSARHDCA
jgi:putative membrane protein